MPRRARVFVALGIFASCHQIDLAEHLITRGVE